MLMHLLTVKNGLSDLTKRKEVGINRETTSIMNIREKLSRRAVMKEKGLGQVCLNREVGHQKKLN